MRIKLLPKLSFRTAQVLAFLLLAAGYCAAQETLTNDSILKLVKAGLGEDLIVSMVNQQPGAYSLKADDVIALKGAGASDKVLAAMIAKGGTRKAEPAAPAGSVMVAPVQEVGVYYKKADQWTEMLPEVVNWKTGGVLKKMATAGIVKGDVNGTILGRNSRNAVKSPVEVLIYTVEGIAITEYQLLRLRQKEELREFRTVTGGVFHASGGATRDLVPFEGKKIATRMWVVSLSSLGPGEYGFLAPGAVASQHASAQLGKMYTFRLLE